MTELERFLARAESLLGRIETLLPAAAPDTDWQAHAFRWRSTQGRGHLQAVTRLHGIRLDDLRDIEAQKEQLERNTRQFLEGKGANNVLLTGARGTGKSSLVKALLNRYAPDGLRLIEVDKDDLCDLPDIVDRIAHRPERFILFCDDLSFEATEAGYKALKSVLDGSLSAVPDNVLLYATSNRRHLMPEYFEDNRDTRHQDGEIHPGEAVEEKISLSDRFGLWLSFYPFDQEAYLRIVAGWLADFGLSPTEIEAARSPALLWALSRGSRSGRIAWQFAKDYAGQRK